MTTPEIPRWRSGVNAARQQPPLVRFVCASLLGLIVVLLIVAKMLGGPRTIALPLGPFAFDLPRDTTSRPARDHALDNFLVSHRLEWTDGSAAARLRYRQDLTQDHVREESFERNFLGDEPARGRGVPGSAGLQPPACTTDPVVCVQRYTQTLEEKDYFGIFYVATDVDPERTDGPSDSVTIDVWKRGQGDTAGADWGALEGYLDQVRISIDLRLPDPPGFP